ncbi:hypothetical protein [Maritalea porphyrae]|jgi:FtsH-binding integral membrane protein|uniref:hypothetical protein n=1 Tax=Maritalea porphyrae TaxID=880732 RepID=UPI0022AF7A42|nr:hypothetical protein [Maritalea porphyrae]MCZ4272012.1 hypothetical protein [Maritalea porphyrae]
MSILQRADWAFGAFWAVITGTMFGVASVFVLEKKIDLEFILQNIALWTFAGIVMAIVIGLKRR